MTSRKLKLWSAVHTWTSLVSMVFMLMLCVTGLPLIFHHELNHALGYESDPPEMPAGTPFVSLDRVIEVGKAQRPNDVVQFLFFDRDEPNVAMLWMAKTLDTPGEEGKPVAVDRRTAAILKEPKITEGPVAFLLKLHTDMFLGLGGKLFLGAMTFVFLVAIVSGVVLYAPFMRKLEFGTVRRGRSRRLRWLDIHNLAGIVTVAWVFLVGATGMINTWADLMVKLWQYGQLAEMTAPYRDRPAPSRLSSLQGAVDTAVAAAPAMKPLLVAFPGTTFSSKNHYAVFMMGNTPVTSRVLQPALIDAQTGAFTDTRPMPWYVQTLFLSQPLHFGDYGGLPLKIVWAILDVAAILVLGSGLYLWLARRKKGVSRVADAGVEAAATSAPLGEAAR
jgi:uncharacterized iron-regulated membrane protein